MGRTGAAVNVGESLSRNVTADSLLIDVRSGGDLQKEQGGFGPHRSSISRSLFIRPAKGKLEKGIAMSESTAVTAVPAKVPEHRLRRPEPTAVRHMLVGDEWYILFTDVVVINGRAWVDGAAARTSGVNRVRLRRGTNGFHMTIQDDVLWFTETLSSGNKDLLPILSITEIKEARADAPLGTAIRELMALRSELERACREDDPEEIGACRPAACRTLWNGCLRRHTHAGLRNL